MDIIYTIPSEFQDAILLAITPTKHFIGIKIFKDIFVSDQNGNMDDDFDEFIGRCVRDAVDLKQSIEAGMHYLENDPRIVKNPNSNRYVDMEKLLELRKEKRKQVAMIKHEILFIDLGRTLIQSVEIGRFNYGMCMICIVELASMLRQNWLTPLMLKKSPAIVEWTAKLCRFMDKNPSTREQPNSMDKCQKVRTESNKLLNWFKVLMDFDGPNDAFMEYFAENVKLFHELTTNLTDIEKRQLTVDPELNLMNDIMNDDF